MSGVNGTTGGNGTSPVSDGYIVTIDAGAAQVIDLNASSGPGPASAVEIRNVSAYPMRATLNTLAGGAGVIPGNNSAIVLDGATLQLSFDDMVIHDLKLELVKLPPLTTAGVVAASSAPVTTLSAGKGRAYVTFA